MKKTFFLIILLLATALLLSGCTQPAENGNGGNNTGNGGIQMDEKVVENGDSIAVEYKGTLEDGTQFDSSEGRDPLGFVVGAGQMIKGFDSAVVGMKLNQEKTVTLQPSEAYGETDPARIAEIPKAQINDVESLAVGMSVTNSQGINGVVKEIKDDVIIIDFNHQLAGKALVFWIKVVRLEKQ